jgi:hypothetical protein
MLLLVLAQFPVPLRMSGSADSSGRKVPVLKTLVPVIEAVLLSDFLRTRIAVQTALLERTYVQPLPRKAMVEFSMT